MSTADAATGPDLSWTVEDDGPIELVALLPDGVRCLWRWADGRTFQSWSGWNGTRRTLENRQPDGRLLDRTCFHRTGAVLVEAPRPGGRGITIPVTLARGQVVEDADGAGLRVEVVQVGRAVLRGGERCHEGRALVLRARMPEGGMEQVMLEGLGEVALRAVDGGWSKWVVGWEISSGAAPDASELPLPAAPTLGPAPAPDPTEPGCEIGIQARSVKPRSIGPAYG